MSFPRLEDLVEALRREVGQARAGVARQDAARRTGGDSPFDTRVAAVRLDFNASVERVASHQGKSLLALRLEGPATRGRQLHQVSLSLSDGHGETVDVRVNGVVLRRYGAG